MSDGNPPVRVHASGAVGVIELARPEIGNALSTVAHDMILGSLRRFEADGAVRAVLIRAEGRNFCAGADLGEVKRLRESEPQLRQFIEHGLAVLAALETSDLPVVVAVQGLCLAGGLELLLACDVAFAAQSARFGDQHAQFGLIPGWGGTQRLPAAVGLRRALDLLFSARWINAAVAAEWGLVNYVVGDDQLNDSVLAYCRTLAGRSAAGLAAMKRLARRAKSGETTAGLREETRAVVSTLRGPDATEGLTAFEERRPAMFGNRHGVIPRDRD